MLKKNSKNPHPGSLPLADPPHKGEGEEGASEVIRDSSPRKRGEVKTKQRE